MLIVKFLWKLQPPQRVKRRRAQCAPPPSILDNQKSPHLLGLKPPIFSYFNVGLWTWVGTEIEQQDLCQRALAAFCKNLKLIEGFIALFTRPGRKKGGLACFRYVNSKCPKVICLTASWNENSLFLAVIKGGWTWLQNSQIDWPSQKKREIALFLLC